MKTKDFDFYWNQAWQLPANRSAYYASRAWQMKRQKLAQRSNGKCERCGWGRFEIPHHLTYIHFGNELMKELQAICRDCHAYIHAKSDYDPAQRRPDKLQLSLF